MDVSKKEGITSFTNPKRLILGFRDSDKVTGISNEIFLLVIITNIANFDVSRVLIEGGSSCDIMYVDLFEKIGSKKENLFSHEGSYLKKWNSDLSLWIL